MSTHYTDPIVGVEVLITYATEDGNFATATYSDASKLSDVLRAYREQRERCAVLHGEGTILFYALTTHIVRLSEARLQG